jgi:hypothetical protein
LVVVVDFEHYQGPIYDKQHQTHVSIVPIKKRREPSCCTRKKIHLHIAWEKTIHSVQGHNAGPTVVHQTLNVIKRIVVHLGDRKYEALNPGLTYTVISRATTI